MTRILTDVLPVSVLIPWRPQPSRLDAFDRLRAWYEREIPEATVRTIDSPDLVFNLAQCRNLGVAAAAPGEVVVLNDADTIPEADALRTAIAAARDDHRVHLPYTEYRWLGRSGSAEYAGGTELIDCTYELVHGACSGVYVTTPEAWQAHGGQDERFRGWGFEDAAWHLAHSTLLGSAPVRHAGRVYALHHVGADRFGSQYDANAALMDRYRGVAGDADGMARLVAEALSASRALAAPGA
ncbi:galactosyltransferase-related protein [Naasia aerilata]|uniref:galactosyltransferase-related protein n=1 Tax=Naasia aerilata TaxID=1162966 RepID=UPI002573AB38|nr:galactosyltransferase-related protein [Naasia aerilata]